MKYFENVLHWYQFDMNYPLYWKARLYIQNGGGIIRYLLLLYVRHCESKRNSTTGTGIYPVCTKLMAPLNLPHGMIGIVFGRNVVVGRNVTVNQHVTIAEADKTKKTIIEDDVMIGAGAVILNNAHIGKGAKIGANAVVTGDVPAGATAIGVPAKIIYAK